MCQVRLPLEAVPRGPGVHAAGRHAGGPAAGGRAVLAMELSTGEPILEGIEVDGRLAVIYSKYDLSCALERQATAACAGYTTEDATKIAINTLGPSINLSKGLCRKSS